MKAAIFEMDCWFGHEKHLIKGSSAAEILNRFDEIQNLSCLLMMGRDVEKKKGQKQLDILSNVLEKSCQDDFSMQDLLELDVTVSIGAVKCSYIAETDEEIQKLANENPDAFSYPVRKESSAH